MATVNYTCPNCAAPLKFNPDKQMFSCEYCMSDFTEQYVKDFFAAKEQKQSSAEKQEQKARDEAKEAAREESKSADKKSDKKEAEQAVVYNCPSCGAQVVTTESTAATTCFYCQNPVVLGGRLSGEFKPDRVIPFKLSMEKAKEKFLEMCGKKHFLPKAFANKSQFEKLNGVYFPYWYVDSEREAHMTAKGEKVRTWRVGNKQCTETKVFRLHRGGDLEIDNVFERALKSEDRQMLQCVHPYDLKSAKPFAMSYLSGFQAEKRDIEKSEAAEPVDKRIDGYCQTLLKNTMDGYTALRVEDYSSKTNLEKWSYTLLPVWIVTYKHGGKIFPFAINGQTGKTYGELPVSWGKLAALGAVIAVALMALGLIGGMLLC